MTNNLQYLDFCRVKKIFDKGYGFLTSIYYDQNVFFHFSKIKNEEVKKKLNDLKRGIVYIFYTATNSKGKLKVDRIWFDLKEVEPKLVNPFVLKIIDCFSGSKTNPYELAHVVLLLREANLINRNSFEKLLTAPNIRKIPSLLSSMLSEKEKEKISDLESLFEEADKSEAGYTNLCNRLIKEFY